MSKKGKVLHNAERNILFRVMNFFEEEKSKKLDIKPLTIKDVMAMKAKNIVKKKKLSELTEMDTIQPTEVEIKLLENEEKYQALLKSYDNIVRRTAAATGVSERTLGRIRLEAKNITAADSSASAEPGTSTKPAKNVELQLFTPKKKKPPKKRLEIDDFMICSIRNIIEEYYSVKKEVPTLRKILAQAKQQFNFPGQKGTLWKIITTQLGYKFKSSKVSKDNNAKKKQGVESVQYMPAP